MWGMYLRVHAFAGSVACPTLLLAATFGVHYGLVWVEQAWGDAGFNFVLVLAVPPLLLAARRVGKVRNGKEGSFVGSRVPTITPDSIGLNTAAQDRELRILHIAATATASALWLFSVYGLLFP